MTGTDYGFVERELEKAGYFTDGERGTAAAAAVRALFAVLDGQELPLEERGVVARLFGHLAENDGSLGNQAGPRSEWKQFYLGVVPYGTTVRVKPDAYDTVTGKPHNGLTGTFVSARAGRCVIQYHGRVAGYGHEHHPSKVEILKK